MTANHSVAVFAKRDCPTCQLVVPVVRGLAGCAPAVRVYSQDDPGLPDDLAGVVDDRELAESFRHRIEIVPTLIRFEDGAHVAPTKARQFTPSSTS